jgi:hypothetical protein
MSASAVFKKGQPNSLLQSALGISRPPSGQGIPRNASSMSLSKQSYVTPAVVSSAQQFHEHFSHLTSSLLHSQDSAYRTHLEEVKAYGDACRIVGEDLQQSEDIVDAMIGCLKWVEERGESLRIAGETLMQEEVCLPGSTTVRSMLIHQVTAVSVSTQPTNDPSLISPVLLYLFGTSSKNAQ